MDKYDLIQHTVFKMKKIVKDFLLENGGYENGFETYVDTCVRYNWYRWEAKWGVPNMKKMTFEEYGNKGKELYEKLRECIDPQIRDIEFEISSQDDEYGCYTLRIQAQFPREEIHMSTYYDEEE